MEKHTQLTMVYQQDKVQVGLGIIMKSPQIILLGGLLKIMGLFLISDWTKNILINYLVMLILFLILVMRVLEYEKLTQITNFGIVRLILLNYTDLLIIYRKLFQIFQVILYLYEILVVNQFLILNSLLNNSIYHKSIYFIVCVQWRRFGFIHTSLLGNKSPDIHS